jgi:hypothetical protein
VLFGGREQVARPRPFVLRCRNLDGRTHGAGETFSLHLNLFLPDLDLLEALTAALTAMSEAGFGPSRSRASLLGPPEYVRHSLALDGAVEPTRAVRIHFHTPTELKSHGEITEPRDFPILIAQVCSRLNRLSGLYGSGELKFNGTLLMKQAGSVVLTAANLRRVDISRRGSRSGQTHPLGGFIGSIDYAGDLSQFVPLLEAASFTGIGRHTVWGNGEISTERLD